MWRDVLRPSLILLCGLATNFAAVHAGDWPQILGPNRTGAAIDEKLADAWPAAGPVVTWEKEVGPGYAGLAVVGPRAYLFHRQGDFDVLEALDSTTGKTIWKQADPTSFTPGVGSGDGPLCVPTVADGHVVTFSPQGLLIVRNAVTGQLVWKHATHQEFGGQEGYFGAGNSPLVAGQVVIVNVGGAKSGAGVVGFDLKAGTPLWKQVADQASYSAPILIRDGDRDLAIVITRLKCVALEPATGALVWEVPFGQRGPTVNGALPSRVEGRLFLTASYGIGGVLLDLKPHAAEIVWEDTDTLASQYATPVEADGLLYGFHGRDDVPPAEFRCIDPLAASLEKRVLWSVPDFGYGTPIKADGKLILAKTDGELILADVNREKFTPRSRFRAFNGIIRALPALSAGGLFVRDEQTLKRFDIGKH
ncbi:Outer membrane protein assembly factor BamB [Caulifigura coniformis]|uniref:Outer membrane protein assembly factor BamB n=1 Tax=Caulifigura coniformis TaxID=2527983 RepID=A0A517SAK5_9PLAN|nr:PQQ-binding-like beta-propeller repeat protein [Caulifigura coniformis]QDT53167.1 Outer membrane protein assembly factor BamB [Caulifigura coniformis]